MDFAVIIDNLPLYWQGFGLTVELLLLSLLCGLLLALPMGIAAASAKIWVNALPRGFIYFFRGSPLLVQMFLVYHGLAQFEWIRNSMVWPFFREAYWCALFAFSLNTAAYTAEILRGAIVQTAARDIEAARACGMSRAQVLWWVILPSAWRRALPSYANEAIFMLHGTALAGVITLLDLFGAARLVNSRHFVPFESFIVAGLFYLGLTFLLVLLFKLAEHKWHAHLRPRKSA